MMRWSFWLFVLAEFCRRCESETKGTWRGGVCSGVPSGVQGQSSWGGQGNPYEAVGFSPGMKMVSLAFWKCYKDVPLGQAYSQVRYYRKYPIIFPRFCANLVSGPGGQWVTVQTPPTAPRGLATVYYTPHAKVWGFTPWRCLSVGLFVRSSVACEISEVVRYVAAPGGERWLIVSTPIHLFAVMGTTLWFKKTRQLCRTITTTQFSRF